MGTRALDWLLLNQRTAGVLCCLLQRSDTGTVAVVWPGLTQQVSLGTDCGHV
jgi:hypothetical protein